MAFKTQEILLSGENKATVQEIANTEGAIITRVEFAILGDETNRWIKELEQKFPNHQTGAFPTAGLFTVEGPHGEKIYNILSGHDKGGDDASPSSPPAGGNPTKGGPHTPLVPGNCNDDARYRTMTGQTGRTSILPRSK